MPTNIEVILEAEREAAKIVENAMLEAERIRKESDEKGSKALMETYEQTIKEAETDASQIKKTAREKAEAEAKLVLAQAEKQVKEIETNVEKKFDAAVRAILNETLS